MHLLGRRAQKSDAYRAADECAEQRTVPHQRSDQRPFPLPMAAHPVRRLVRQLLGFGPQLTCVVWWYFYLRETTHIRRRTVWDLVIGR